LSGTPVTESTGPGRKFLAPGGARASADVLYIIGESIDLPR
jgi:hypothetical protein